MEIRNNYAKKTMLAVLLIVFCLAIVKYYREGRFMLRSSLKDIYNINVNEDMLAEEEQKLNIIHVPFCWSEELNYNNKPIILIYHHTAIKDISVEEVDELHKKRGFIGIGYNYYIDKDGLIYQGRPNEAEGAHALGNNKISIGICLEGNFEEEYPTNGQLKSVESLSLFLCLKYNIKDIVGHRDVKETLCPGKNFPLKQVRENVIVSLKNYNKNHAN